MMRPISLALAVMFLLGSATAAAQDTPTISTDRPSFSAGSSTVPEGRFQLEGGLGFEYRQTTDCFWSCPLGHKIANLPNLLGRLGVAEFAEIRLGIPNVAMDFERSDGPVFGDASVGFKVGAPVTERVSIGLVGFGAYGIDSGGVSAGATATADLSATDWLGFTANGGATVNEGGGAELSASALAAFGLTDTLQTYLEWYVISADGRTVHLADVGMTFLLNSQMQVDAFVGVPVGGDRVAYGEKERLVGGVGLSKLF